MHCNRFVWNRIHWTEPLLMATAVGIALCILAPTVLGQNAEPAVVSSPSPAAVPTLGDIQQLKKQVQESETLDEESKTKLLETYDRALAQLKPLEEARAQKATYAQQAAAAPPELEKLKAQLAEPVVETVPQVPAGAGVTELEQLQTTARNERDEIQKRATALENEPKRRLDRRAKVPEEIRAAKEQLAQVLERLAALQAEAQPTEQTRSGRVLAQLQQAALEARIAALEEEIKYYDASRDLLAAQRDQAARALAGAEKRVKFWDEAVTEARRQQAEKVTKEAQQAVKEAKYLHPVIKQIAEENATLAGTQTDVLTKLEQTMAYAKDVETQFAKVTDDYADLTKQIEQAGEVTNVMGVLLLTKRGDLPDVQPNRDRIKLRLGKIASAQLRWDDYDRQWSALSNTEEQAQAALAGGGVTEDHPEYARIQAEAVKLLTERRKILQTIAGYYLDYSDLLAKLDVQERSFIRTVQEFERFIDENILWVRSTPRLGKGDIASALAALRWIVSPSNWHGAVTSLGKSVRQNAALYIIFAAVLAPLFWYRRKMSGLMETLAKRMDHRYTDRLLHTIKTAVLTVLLAIPLPMILLFIAWQLQTADATRPFAEALGSGLWAAGVILAVYGALLFFCRPSGLGYYLGFRQESLDVLRRHLLWFFSLLIPLMGFAAMLSVQRVDETWANSLGRLLFLIEQGVVAGFLLIVLRPRGGVLQEYLQESKTGWLGRLFYGWYGLCLIVPATFCVLAILGYFYAAQHLYSRLLSTLLLILGVAFLDAFMMRWLLVTQQRLAIRQQKKRRDGTRTSAETVEARAARTGDVPEESAEAIVTISEQTTKLIHAVTFLLLIVGLWWIWREILPALGALENVRIGSTTNAQGAEVTISLGSVFKAVLIFIMTVIVARNVPGLLEIVVLQRLPLDRGVRFAITSLSRYTLVVVGVVLTFQQIGLGWAKVQWLIAAMTVGLGFGLQEIFANFVSGLIILFEQPIRVGDVVTVGDVNGKVAKIQIRATTIRKWDQKELIVPNKEFITNRLINWSLSDRTLRMEFPVGVA